MVAIANQMTEMARRSRAAARQVARLSSEEKSAALAAMASALEAASPALLAANAEDVASARESGLSGSMLDRLALTGERVAGMAQGLRHVAGLPDPSGQVLETVTRPNGLRLEKVSTPMGVILIIYEARPNVTADAAGLCFKSGNATILRGGKEALRSNQLIARTLTVAGRDALGERFPADAIQAVATADREAVNALLSMPEYIDLCIPRGGEGLIRTVTENSRVPVIKHYKGVCHVFVDRDADVGMAARIVDNAKTQRPSTCNAVETVLIDAPVAAAFIGAVAPTLAKNEVQWRGDAATLTELAKLGGSIPARRASDGDYGTEYNDYILNARVVGGLDEALDHIARFGSAHSDAIVTANPATARRFLAEVDSAAVYWNASTRFTDGGEFGMGAEIGISTDKLHARGPMGLRELCTYKWLGVGSGQVRQ